jgi:malonyl-CoA/methylmalonyl-CoA synthetase
MHLQHRTLPNDILFSRLLKLATEKENQVIVDDHSHGTQFGYRHILHGTSKLLQKLQSLDERPLNHGGNVYIGVLAPNGYEFIVAVLAVLAFGGVVVPMRRSPSQILMITERLTKKKNSYRCSSLRGGIHAPTV